MRNVLAHAGKSGRRVVSAFIATGVPMVACCHGVGHRLRADRRRGGEPAKRRIEAVSIFPNQAAITRLVGALLLE